MVGSLQTMASILRQAFLISSNLSGLRTIGLVELRLELRWGVAMHPVRRVRLLRDWERVRPEIRVALAVRDLLRVAKLYLASS